MKYLVSSKNIAIGVAVTFSILSFLVKGMEMALLVPINHLDGAFQTASGLFRISEGQWPGRDFYSYLGVGLLLFLYPIFALFGESLAATVVASHFSVYFVLFFSIYIVFRLSSPEIDKRWPLMISILVVGLLFISSFDLHLLRDRFSPGNSLRPVRAFLPYLAFFILYLLLKSILPTNKKIALASILAALCFLWSNDFAIPTAFLVLVTTFFWLAFRRELDLKRLCILIAFFIAGVFSVLNASTLGHALDFLTYNLVDVRKDQYWYFAPWFSYSRVFEIADIRHKVLPDYGWQIYLIPLTFLVACFSRRLEFFCFSLIGVAAFLGGVVATIGGHRGGYQGAYLYWSYIAIGAAFWGGLCLLGYSAAKRIDVISQFVFLRRPMALALNLAIVLGAFILFYSNYDDYSSKEERISTSPHLYFENELGGYIDRSWISYINQAKYSDPSLSVVEEYWGIWGAVTRTFAPKTDSVIHALGGVREKFLQQPELVITTRASVSYWQQWSFSANYWFYSELLKQYRVVGFSPTTLIWKKNEVRKEFEYADCIVDRDHNRIVLNVEQPGHYELELIIDISLITSRSLVLVKNNINYAWGADGYLSLDTSRVRHTIPVGIPSVGRQELPLRIINANHEGMASKDILLGCRMARIPAMIHDVTKSVMAQREPYPLTDRNWTGGVSNFSPIVLLSNTTENSINFRKGNIINFSDGTNREIVRVQKAGPYLNAHLSGENLDSDIHGYPNSFSVLNLNQEPFPLSDKNWTAGIGHFGSVILLGNTQASQAALNKGGVIRFWDGEEREVVGVNPKGRYLHVYFSGDQLDPEVYGYPNSFTVIPARRVVTRGD